MDFETCRKHDLKYSSGESFKTHIFKTSALELIHLRGLKCTKSNNTLCPLLDLQNSEQNNAFFSSLKSIFFLEFLIETVNILLLMPNHCTVREES